MKCHRPTRRRGRSRPDWTVDLSKPDFIGKKALEEKKGKERSFVTGLEVDIDRAIEPGAKITADGKDVGVVTSTTYSKYLMKIAGDGSDRASLHEARHPPRRS